MRASRIDLSLVKLDLHKSDMSPWYFVCNRENAHRDTPISYNYANTTFYCCAEEKKTIKFQKPCLENWLFSKFFLRAFSAYFHLNNQKRSIPPCATKACISHIFVFYLWIFKVINIPNATIILLFIYRLIFAVFSTRLSHTCLYLTLLCKSTF